MRDLRAALDALRERLGEIVHADARRLQELKTEILGRKAGALTNILKALPRLPAADRKAVGGAANALKREFEAALEARETELAGARPDGADVDLTMPGRATWTGGLHLVTQVVDEICEIFHELGFTRAVGPEAETEHYNFYALNFPKDHPALDAQDSFYVGGELLLRTHTSPVQIRTLETFPPPVRVVIPGRVFRRDPFDPSHSPVFEQIEGLAVDAGITFVDLKATLTAFARQFFSSDTRVRFRPSYFPFTEPSAEMDVQCRICGGAGCPTCKQTGWMEILGAGMVHPAVLDNAGVDSEAYTGFAWGMGPDRIAMSRHGIPDIRLLYEADVRFLSQFAAGVR
jgi:phenylalanyl-tRNA synthetase alpha chain